MRCVVAREVAARHLRNRLAVFDADRCERADKIGLERMSAARRTRFPKRLAHVAFFSAEPM